MNLETDCLEDSWVLVTPILAALISPPKSSKGVASTAMGG